MKTASIILSFMAMVLIVGPIHAAEKDLNIREGLSNIKWGTNPETVKGPTKVFQKGDILYLKIPDEQFILGDVNLGSVLYGFYENKFFAAYMRIRSKDEAEKLIKILSSDYGPVRRQLRVKETIYIWDYHDIKIKLKEREDPRIFKLSFYYTPLSAKLNESRMEQNDEIIMDLVPTR